MKLSCAGSGSSGNCYSLTDDKDKVLLLDAGVPLPEIKKLVNWKVSDISACFVTHIHDDHSKSADKLRNMGIRVFEPYKGGRQRFIKDGWKLFSFPVMHDGTECRAAYIVCPDGHKLLYMTDLSYCKYRFIEQKINTMLIECNYMDDMDEENESKRNHVFRGHMSLKTCKEFIKVNQTEELKNIILCHLSSENSNESEMIRQVREVVGDKVNVIVAKKGVEITLDE